MAAEVSLGKRNFGLSSPLWQRNRLRRFLTTWLGTVILAVNLFGWTLTSSLPETVALSPSDTVVDLFDGMPWGATSALASGVVAVLILPTDRTR